MERAFPIAWQGWLVLVLLMLVSLFPWLLISRLTHSAWVMEGDHGTEFMTGGVIVDIVALVALLSVSKSRTAGGWHWRWGERD